jgi:hypothetical protein
MHEKRIIIWDEEEGTVKQMVVTTTNTTTIPKAVRSLNQSGIETPVLPYGTVMLKKNGNTSIYLVQRPEEKLVVRYKERIVKSVPVNFTIAFPWRVFALVFKGSIISDYNLRFAKGPIHTMEDSLYMPPLPNIEKDGGMCMGSGMIGFAGKTGPLSEITERVLAWVDKTNYNDDLKSNIHLLPKEMDLPPTPITMNVLQAFEIWEKWTKDAGRKWRGINKLSWHQAETFEQFAGRIV